ncbi:hypothetical protein RMSM_00878 [Rhodopirellula maiorica SM1]|uniref:Uncharacterized protein n=1 Tax=Rhodopirellula maiorica SM1 TaxID=1265738 RepID=M5RSB2_9BACT|nr:hypothetical protein RMSM_00878 [Rhodopirellula maiorica SM1]
MRRRPFICARRLLVASIATYPNVENEADRFAECEPRKIRTTALCLV